MTSVTIARGGEAVFRGSLFRSGYEVFYTPIPPKEKRAAKKAKKAERTRGSTAGA